MLILFRRISFQLIPVGVPHVTSFIKPREADLLNVCVSLMVKHRKMENTVLADTLGIDDNFSSVSYLL